MYKAVIFDMNGVIVNDERIHQEAWRQLMTRHNIVITEEDFHAFVFGRIEKEVLQWVLKREITEAELQTYSDERVAIVIDIFRPRLQATEGFVDFVTSLKAGSIKLGIATGSRNRYKDFILDGLNIRTYFDAVVTAEDIQKGKPDPEIYVKTAELLNVLPKDCLVFEDSKSGIASGKAAGMKVVALTTTYESHELSGYDFILPAFDDVSLDRFL